MAPLNPKVAQCIEMAKDFDHIKQQLKSKERTIQKMLKKSAENRKYIREKIYRMQKLANQIPDDYGNFDSKWSDKLAALWRRYNDDMKDNDVVMASESDSEKNKHDNEDRKIRFKIESFLRKFGRIKDVIDIEDQKHLLEFIAKVQLVILKASKEVREPLERDAFSLIFSKLPEAKQEQFNHLCDRGQRVQTLKDLRKYLQDEIILYTRLLNSGELFGDEFVVQITPEGISSRSVMSKRDRSISLSGDSSSLSNNSAAEQQKQNSACHYCKNIGHSIALCPERNAVLCLRCFAYGHTKNHCRSSKKHIGLEDIKA